MRMQHRGGTRPMLNLQEIEDALSLFDAQVTEASAHARERLGRKPKLGELSLQDDLYQRILPVLAQIYHDLNLRTALFGPGSTGKRSRAVMLIFMSEMIYWEYESSFWRILYESFQVDGTGADYGWFTSQMVRGYREQKIPLIETYQGRQYVRTIVSQSGFSRQMVQAARDFIVWFFNRVPDLDPRRLDNAIVEKMLEEYDFAGGEDLIDLLREMIWDVSMLLRLIRKKSLISTDLRDPAVLAELQEQLGFHPIKDIFGFRNDEDIQDLLETLSDRISPTRLYSYLVKRTAGRRRALRITLPSGMTVDEISPASIPLEYGVYRLEPDLGNVYVVPRESITFSRFIEMLQKEAGKFQRDGASHVFMHNKDNFVVLAGGRAEESPCRYSHDKREGYFWYGRQRIGIPLVAQKDDEVIARLDPYFSTSLSPRLRLDPETPGLQVMIPSFATFLPDHAGATCRLFVNHQPVVEEPYLVDRVGFLQLQGTRVASVDARSQDIDVFLKRVDDGATLAEARLELLRRDALLFSGNTREIIQPGKRRHGESDLYLLLRKAGDCEADPGVRMTRVSELSDFHLYHVHWGPERSGTIHLRAGSSLWEFESGLQVDLILDVHSSHPWVKPLEPNCAFSVADVSVRLVLSGNSDDVEDARRDLILIVDKDDEFLSDYSLLELEKNQLVDDRGAVPGEYRIHARRLTAGLLEAGLTDTEVGSWQISVGRRTPGARDTDISSQASFIVLPELEVQTSDELLVEGSESFLVVRSDNPFLADYDERPSTVVRIPFSPELHLDIGDERLKTRQAEKVVRLYYPPTRIKVIHTPKLVFGIRVIQERVLPGIDGFTVDARSLRTSRLYARGKPGEILAIRSVTEVVERRFDDSGNLKISLSMLSKHVGERLCEFHVTHADRTKHFNVEWLPELRFRPDGCGWTSRDSGVPAVSLSFEADGPPDEIIRIQAVDHQGEVLCACALPVSDLAAGELAVDLAAAMCSDETVYFVALSDDGPLDIIAILPDNQVLDSSDLVERNVLPESEALSKRTHAELFRLLGIVDLLKLDKRRASILSEMFTVRCLEQIYSEVKRGELEEEYARKYFRYYDPKLFPGIDELPIPKLKQFCILPCPPLTAACSRALLAKNDGVGVDHVIEDLLLPGYITFETGVDILKTNEACSEEVIRDIVDFDELVKTEESRIDLLVKLCEIFHPAAKRKARAARDWKRAFDAMHARKVELCEVIDCSPYGLNVAYGLLVGDVLLRDFDAEGHGLSMHGKILLGRLSLMLGERIPLIPIAVERRAGVLKLSEKDARSKLLSQMLLIARVGDEMTARVVSFTRHGIFVDLGGTTGLIHGDDLHAKDNYRNLKRGDPIQVQISRIDRQKKMISVIPA
jgi:hypothetical protein